MIVTLTTDFGDSAYVAQMKGVILRIAGDATIVDLTHSVRPQDVRQGAFALYAAAPSFPPAVHVAVVDPGVGSERVPLAVLTEAATFVGPDNGLLIPAARRLGIREVRRIENRALMADDVSATFHGRDVFAPVAAHLARGAPFASVGPVAERWTDLDFGSARKTDDGLEAQAITVDRFGNVILNVTGTEFEAFRDRSHDVRIEVVGRAVDATLERTYSDAGAGEVVVLVGSSGLAEIAVNRGDAGSRLLVSGGEIVRLRFVPSKG